MKVALVHDHLIQIGGAEKVLQVLARMYPDAPIFTLLYEEKNMNGLFPKDRIRPSFLQKWPLALSHYQWYLPLMPHATESYDLSGFDLVISSASGMAKGVITGPETTHICYCHTPTRYLWSHTHEHLKTLKRNRLTKYGIYPFLPSLRTWDFQAAQRPNFMVANSETVKARIEKYYHRDSTVIFPPVETKKFSVSEKPGEYFLIGGRLVAYKRYDIAIRAMNAIGARLKVFGTGPEEKFLRSIAKPNIEFVGPVDDVVKAELYKNAIAFLHPHVEDFGITAVESMASGRPVIAFGEGGAAETVVPGLTGLFMGEQTPESLLSAIDKFRPQDFDPKKIAEHAENFSEERFIERMSAFVAQKMDAQKQAQ